MVRVNKESDLSCLKFIKLGNVWKIYIDSLIYAGGEVLDDPFPDDTFQIFSVSLSTQIVSFNRNPAVNGSTSPLYSLFLYTYIHYIS